MMFWTGTSNKTVGAKRNEYLKQLLSERTLSQLECESLFQRIIQDVEFDDTLMDMLIPYMERDINLTGMVESYVPQEIICSAKYFRYFAVTDNTIELASTRLSENTIDTHLGRISDRKLILIHEHYEHISDDMRERIADELISRLDSLKFGDTHKNHFNEDVCKVGLFLRKILGYRIIPKYVFDKKYGEADTTERKSDVLSTLIDSVALTSHDIDESINRLDEILKGETDEEIRRIEAHEIVTNMISTELLSDEQYIRVIEICSTSMIFGMCIRHITHIDFKMIDKYWDWFISESVLLDEYTSHMVDNLSHTEKISIWERLDQRHKHFIVSPIWFGLDTILKFVSEFNPTCWSNLINRYIIPDDILIAFNREIILYTGDEVKHTQVLPQFYYDKYDMESKILAIRANCGLSKRRIRILKSEPHLILIGCSSLTQEQAIKAVNSKYGEDEFSPCVSIDTKEICAEYIDAINSCFEEAKSKMIELGDEVSGN